jgi:prepilin signal peptidase PulO-like enzyme (type II secretory pathway)
MLSSLPLLSQCIMMACVMVMSLCAGSFMNMLRYRLPLCAGLRPDASEKKISLSYPRSFCPACRTPLWLRDLIPVVGYLLQKGRCRHCKNPIPRRYLITELMTVLLVVSLVVFYGINLISLKIFVYACLAYMMIDLDMRYQWLPDVLNYSLLWSGLIFSCFSLAGPSPEQAILGAASGYLLLWLLNAAYRALRHQDGIGGGDMKLLAALAAWFGLAGSLVVFWFAVVITLIVALGLKACARFAWQQRIAFGPGLLASGAVVLLFPGTVHAVLGLFSVP